MPTLRELLLRLIHELDDYPRGDRGSVAPDCDGLNTGHPLCDIGRMVVRRIPDSEADQNGDPNFPGEGGVLWYRLLRTSRTNPINTRILNSTAAELSRWLRRQYSPESLDPSSDDQPSGTPAVRTGSFRHADIAYTEAYDQMADQLLGYPPPLALPRMGRDSVHNIGGLTDEDESRLAAIVCKLTVGMTAEHWSRLDQAQRVGWMREAIAALPGESENEDRMESTINDPNLRRDPLWLALDRAIRTVREDKTILFRTNPESETGLNTTMINHLAKVAEISGWPVFEPNEIVQGGRATDRSVKVFHPEVDEYVELWWWKRFGTPNITDAKIERALSYLAEWKERRRAQIQPTLQPTDAKPIVTPTVRMPPTIGIITALPKEYVAMKTLLSAPTEQAIPGNGAGRRYVLGNIPSKHGGEHSVVLCMSSMGNNSASSRATLLLEHFPSVDAIVMTGIAGGIPNPSKPASHVRLGDIVVSNWKGVVQYDMIELGEVTCSPRPPNPRLLEAVNHLEAGMLEKQFPWEEFILTVAQKLGWERPPESSDILHDTLAPLEPLRHPIDPLRREGVPRVFAGVIASSNELLKDPRKRDALRDKHGAKAVEMETSGIADATWNHERGYLGIRGICDYCDTYKNPEWQEHAAIVAAAYTRALIESMPVPTISPNPR